MELIFRTIADSTPSLFEGTSLAVAAGVVLNAFPWLEGYVHVVKFEPPPNADPMAIGVFYLGNFVSKLTFLLPPLILCFSQAADIPKYFG
jgi:hypothetical protein